MQNMSFIKAAGLFAITLVVLVAGCTRKTNQTAAAPEGAGVKSESVVKVVSSPVEIAAGGAADAVFQITVQSGYHINANPPTYPYLKPTEIELKPPAGISVGFISYPNPLLKKFPFAENQLAIYEGSTQVKVMLKATATAARGFNNVPGKLKIQACDDQVCYPPGEISISVPLTTK